MEDLHFKNEREFNEYLIAASKFDKQGKQGTVYRKGEFVIKDFGTKPKIETDHILQFRDLELKDFYFPQAGIYIRTKLRACITEFAPGLTLKEKNILEEDIRTVLIAVKRLEDAIKEASKNKIRMMDVRIDNITFDRDHFNFIDTCLYYFSPLEYEEILKLNLKHVMLNTYLKILPKDLYHYQLIHNGEHALYSFPHENLEELVFFLEKLIGHFSSFSEAQKIIETQKIILPQQFL